MEGPNYSLVRAPSELAISAQDARSVIAAVGADYKLALFNEPGDMLLCAASGRSWLSPTGCHYRFAGVSANFMGPTFACVASVVGTIWLIRKIGILGIGLWGGISAIAGHFGVDVDAEPNSTALKRLDADPSNGASMLEETLLEMMPAALRVGVKNALAKIEGGSPVSEVAGALTAGITGVIPGARMATWLFQALQKLLGVASDAEPQYVLRDNDKQAFASAISVPFSVVDSLVNACEDALTSAG